ncbi:DUF1501 domain-containing protein [Alienimonas californiensis]|uniref:Sulfatase n=1 Tax=Alienimonas californiensis TaxID=2527989 RepID=A0A517PEH8_9PLAN|nr:DUF1501 domain-containing protein [Alienimonas californiensis]QDT17768.1 hypothetical protein CA12_39010 [Alienimonas californiensis]
MHARDPHACHDFAPARTRRDALRTLGAGFGSLALGGMCADLSAAEAVAGPIAAGSRTHHPAKAKRVIFLFMHGGPAQMDTFEEKPRLSKDDGKKLPPRPGALKFNDASSTLLGSPWKFRKYGQCGKAVSELFPHVAQHVDEIAFLHGMHSRGQSHGQAVCMLHTGSDNLPRPSVGSWVSYGLGTENRDLPSFISLAPPSNHGGPRNYGPAFLPAEHQATAIGRAGNLGSGSVQHLAPPKSLSEQRRADQLELLADLNADYSGRIEAVAGAEDPAVEGAIRGFELAHRMAGVAPEALDLSRETKETQALYGVGEKPTDGFAKQCLLARRLCEAGVRYVQVSTGYSWDQHGNLKKGHADNAAKVDQPIAALLADLKRRGLLEDTLVVWGGEFGRTATAQGKDGRDHNPSGFTMWMAGGGAKGGVCHGSTDEFGAYAETGRTHMHDLHATMLHLLGLDHERLTYRHAGRDFRLTDVAGRVVREVIA